MWHLEVVLYARDLRTGNRILYRGRKAEFLDRIVYIRNHAASQLIQTGIMTYRNSILIFCTEYYSILYHIRVCRHIRKEYQG